MSSTLIFLTLDTGIESAMDRQTKRLNDQVSRRVIPRLINVTGRNSGSRRTYPRLINVLMITWISCYLLLGRFGEIPIIRDDA